MKENYSHQNVPTSFIEAGGVSYAYRSFGKTGGTPVVFLQHFTGTMDNWDPSITDPLSEAHHIILFNNRGVSSTDSQTPETISEMADDAIAFIEALGFDKVDLLGFSLGGFVAQYIAERKPSLVRKIILVGTGPRGGEGISNLEKVVAEAVENAPDEVLVYLFFEKSETSKLAGREFVNRLQERKEDRDLPSDSETIAAQTKAINAFGNDQTDKYGQLKKITQPVLVVNGNNDIMVPSINSFYLAEKLPNAKLILWSNSGHGAHFQYNRQFVIEVEAFLA